MCPCFQCEWGFQYADFECLTEELKKPEGDGIKIIKNINLADVCWNLVNAVDNTNHEFLYRGEDAVNVLCKNLSEIRDDIKKSKRLKK